MAKQIAGLCFLEGMIDDLTFYQMDGQYYCRAKSCLTSERVKTSPRFKLTMMSARRLARASKIGAVIYKALPPRWRQCWMYRSFTGEAFTLLKYSALSEEAIVGQLHACYVDYWEKRRAADPDNELWQPLPVKVRKRRQYSEESLQRRWNKMRAKRPRQEIREEKRQEEAARRQAWRDQLAMREAARTGAAALAAEQDRAGEQTDGLTCDLSCGRLATAKAAGEIDAGGQADGLCNKGERRRRLLATRGRRWYIDPHGILQKQSDLKLVRKATPNCNLQKQSVPEVTRKRPTGTRTMFSKQRDQASRPVPCNSS